MPLPIWNNAFSVPLGGLPRGRLVFASKANRVSLGVLPPSGELYRARFKNRTPSITLREGTVMIQYPCFDLLDWPLSRPVAEIRLNRSIPWEVEFRGGVSGLKADLRALQIQAIDILGGASQIELSLPDPGSTVYIYIAGGVSNALIRRPPGIGLRLRLRGGAARLQVDGRRYPALGGETSIESPGFSQATGRYEIDISGGASRLTIAQG